MMRCGVAPQGTSNPNVRGSMPRQRSLETFKRALDLQVDMTTCVCVFIRTELCDDNLWRLRSALLPLYIYAERSTENRRLFGEASFLKVIEGTRMIDQSLEWWLSILGWARKKYMPED